MAIWNDKIRQLRLDYDLTLKDVATVIEVTEATAQRYETGKGIKTIPYNRILKYAELFKVTPEYIMGWDEKDKNNIFSTENAQLITKIRSDEKLIEALKEYFKLSDDKKEYVINTIHLMSK